MSRTKQKIGPFRKNRNKFMNHIHPTQSLLLLFALVIGNGVSIAKTISSGDKLIRFAEEVNSGTTYEGSTVELTADIDLAGKNFIPIGKFVDGGRADFRGVFDGKGHLIKNMNLTSSYAYLGLFGYSNGGTIMNVIVDSSCSITNTNPSNLSYGAGIVGYANGGQSEVKVMNCVNMGTIMGTGNLTRLGGIVGVLFAYSKPATIQNCANFGPIIHLGTGGSVYAGGIAGWMTGLNSNQSSVSNCVNLGQVTSYPQNTGGIVGYSNEGIHNIENNSWAEGTSARSHSGQATNSSNEDLSSERVIEKLNECFPSTAQQKWAKITFDTDGGTVVEPMVALDVLIGTPGTPTKTGHTFSGWYIDENRTQRWNISTEFKNNGTLYAKWTVNNYTLSFMSESKDFIQNITEPYGTNISVYALGRIKEGHNFSGWLEAEGNITYTDTITVYRDACLWEVWVPNTYKVSFVLSDGSTFNISYKYGENITGHTVGDGDGVIFDGWFEDTNYNKQVSFPLRMGPNDIIIYGKWTK